MNSNLIFVFLILMLVPDSPEKSHYTCPVNQKNPPYQINIKNNLGNIKAVNLSTIGNKLKYIPLETNQKCLIKEVDKIAVCDGYIFVSEIDKILQFDINGRFLRQIGSTGRGPAEYLSVIDFCINEITLDIFVISSRILLVYDFDGQFKASYKLSFNPSQVIMKDSSTLMFHLFNLPGEAGNEAYSWIISDLKGTIISRIKNNLKRINSPGIIISDTPFYIKSNSIRFMEFGIDTLYYFLNGRQEPYAIFSFGDSKMNPDILINSSNIREVSLKTKDKIWINPITESLNFLFINVNYGLTNTSKSSLYNKLTGEWIFLKDNGFINNLDFGKDFWPEVIINDNVMIDLIDAYDLLKYLNNTNGTEKGKKVSVELQKVGQKLTETSNPVVVMLIN